MVTRTGCERLHDTGYAGKGSRERLEVILGGDCTVTGKAKTAIKGSTGVAKKSKIKGPSNEQDPTIQDEPREPEAGAAIAGGVAGSARDEFGRAQEANAADWWHLPTRNGAEKEALIRLREARPDIATAPDAGKQVGEGTEHLVEHGPEGTVTKHTKNFGYVLHPTVGPFGGYAELREATPSEYLDRLDETNQRFGVESKVIGLTRTGDHVGFAVRSRKRCACNSPPGRATRTT